MSTLSSVVALACLVGPTLSQSTCIYDFDTSPAFGTIGTVGDFEISPFNPIPGGVGQCARVLTPGTCDGASERFAGALVLHFPTTVVVDSVAFTWRTEGLENGIDRLIGTTLTGQRWNFGPFASGVCAPPEDGVAMSEPGLSTRSLVLFFDTSDDIGHSGGLWIDDILVTYRHVNTPAPTAVLGSPTGHQGISVDFDGIPVGAALTISSQWELEAASLIGTLNCLKLDVPGFCSLASERVHGLIRLDFPQTWRVLSITFDWAARGLEPGVEDSIFLSWDGGSAIAATLGPGVCASDPAVGRASTGYLGSTDYLEFRFDTLDDLFHSGCLWIDNIIVTVASPDCNGNGVDDIVDMALGTSLDCDLNLVPDECDISTDPSIDWNGDGLIDTCAGGGFVYCDSNLNASGAFGLTEPLGSPLIGDDDFSLRAYGLPTGNPGVPGMFIMSRSTGYLNPFGGGAGVLCLGAPIRRFNLAAGFPLQFSGAAGEITLNPSIASFPGPNPVQPGEVIHFQLWFREVDLSTGLPTSNTTDGISVMFR